MSSSHFSLGLHVVVVVVCGAVEMVVTVVVVVVVVSCKAHEQLTWPPQPLSSMPHAAPKLLLQIMGKQVQFPLRAVKPANVLAFAKATFKVCTSVLFTEH